MHVYTADMLKCLKGSSFCSVALHLKLVKFSFKIVNDKDLRALCHIYYRHTSLDDINCFLVICLSFL